MEAMAWAMGTVGTVEGTEAMATQFTEDTTVLIITERDMVAMDIKVSANNFDQIKKKNLDYLIVTSN